MYVVRVCNLVQPTNSNSVYSHFASLCRSLKSIVWRAASWNRTTMNIECECEADCVCVCVEQITIMIMTKAQSWDEWWIIERKNLTLRRYRCFRIFVFTHYHRRHTAYDICGNKKAISQIGTFCSFTTLCLRWCLTLNRNPDGSLTHTNRQWERASVRVFVVKCFHNISWNKS